MPGINILESEDEVLNITVTPNSISRAVQRINNLNSEQFADLTFEGEFKQIDGILEYRDTSIKLHPRIYGLNFLRAQLDPEIVNDLATAIPSSNLDSIEFRGLPATEASQIIGAITRVPSVYLIRIIDTRGILSDNDLNLLTGYQSTASSEFELDISRTYFERNLPHPNAANYSAVPVSRPVIVEFVER